MSSRGVLIQIDRASFDNEIILSPSVIQAEFFRNIGNVFH
jgi:hypothetical protein